MSHEGIRILSEEQARQADAPERVFTRDAIQPASVRVDKTGGTGVEIDWKDGHHSHWTFRWLRDACPCATCIEEREQAGRAPGDPKPTPKAALPMYQAPVRPKEVRPVGRYAIAFDWNDGHTSGIYSWHYLRSICHCQPCAASK